MSTTPGFDVVKAGPVDTHRFVSSSNLVAGLYDITTQDLYIKFHGGRIYVYLQVPHNVWVALKNAPSAGHYHYYNIRMKYVYEELTPSDWPQHGRSVQDTAIKAFLQY